MLNFVWVALVLGGVGFFLKQEVLVGLAWFLLVALVLTYLWQRRVVSRIRIRRVAPTEAFLHDIIPIELVAGNGSALPLPWLTLRDSLPSELRAEPSPNWLLSFRGREQVRLRYNLVCKTRGRYLLGPTEGTAGVVLEPGGDPIGDRLSWSERNRLTIYPQIVPLEGLGLPSRLPMGDLKSKQPLISDPSRIAGLRDYYPGDDPRHIDWRTSARLGSLQIKQFEPTRQMPLAILLDMRLLDYQYWRRGAIEVAIVVAASLASQAHKMRQPFGLFSNGYDTAFRSEAELSAILATEPGPAIAVRNGDAQLITILDKLAGLQPRREAALLENLVSHWTSNITWGSVLIFVGVEPTIGIAAQMLHLRKAGYSPIGIFTAAPDKIIQQVTDAYSIAKLRNLGFAVFEISRIDSLNSLTQ